MPMKTIEGYSKEKYTNTSVLLAGGGAKALSDFIGSLSWDSTNKKIKYTPVGGSATDLVTLSWDNIANKPTSLPANGGNADTSNRAKFLETFQQNSTTNTYGSQYPIWAQWSDSTNVRLKCTNYTVWTDNATTATKIGTSTVGSSTMPVYIKLGAPTAITSFPEAYLSWGGTNTAGSVTPIGMTLSSEHSANRLAFINGNALTFEYSSDAGNTWTDYGYTASIKSQVFTTSYGVPIGRANSSTEYTTNSRTRITLTAQDGTNSCYVYTNPRKMLINISSSGGMQVLIEYRTGTNYKNNSAWTTFGTYTLSGWSGWNDIPLILSTLGGGNTQTSNNWQLRLTFIMTSKYDTYPNDAYVNCIRIFGENAWVPPSTMAATGHLYSFDVGQNATFPGAITATMFKKSGGTSSQFLKADGSVDSNTYLTGITKQMVTNALGYTPPTTNTTYNFSGTSFTSGNSGAGEHDANNITTNGHWYYTSNGPVGASTADGALYSQAYSTSWVGQIAQDYRNGNLFTRGKNNGTWTDWKAVSYAGHTHSYLPLSGGTLTGTLGKSNNYIFKPNGGDFRTITNSYTGAICISLPANIGNTMLSMWIDVYIYSPNKSFSIHVGGYTYNSNFSNSPFAMVYGASHKVRLTYDNGFKIYIGEIDSTWSYPQISIRDVVLGFNQNYSNWINDWSVSFVTSFPTINREITRYAITTDNIGSQSVNHATSATNAENIFLKDASANSDCRLAFGTYNSTYIALNSSQYLTYNPYSGRLKLKGSKEHNSANHGGSISFGDGDFLYMKEAKDDMLLQHYKGLVSDTQPIAIGFVGSCPSNSSASLVYKKSQPSAITVNCTRVSSGRFKVEVYNTSGKPITAHLQVTPVRNYAQYEFAFAYIEDFNMDTADGGMEIASGSTGYFYVRTGRIHCQTSWAAGDYVATGDTGGFTGVVYAMINENLSTMPSTSW